MPHDRGGQLQNSPEEGERDEVSFGIRQSLPKELYFESLGEPRVVQLEAFHQIFFFIGGKKTGGLRELMPERYFNIQGHIMGIKKGKTNVVECEVGHKSYEYGHCSDVNSVP